MRTSSTANEPPRATRCPIPAPRMIILPTSDDIRATLRDHLAQRIDRAAFDPELAEAVASAVVTYLDEQGLAPLCRTIICTC